jgi:hypothetical protein
MADGDDLAKRHAVAQLIVIEQAALIGRLKAAGRDTTGAERLLRSFEDQLRLITKAPVLISNQWPNLSTPTGS